MRVISRARRARPAARGRRSAWASRWRRWSARRTASPRHSSSRARSTLLGALVAGTSWPRAPRDPLRRMARTAAAHRRRRPVPPHRRQRAQRGDPRRSSESFDHMLDRLEDAFARQREFVSDASHELRTPLTVIRGQLEVLARQPTSRAEDVRRVEAVVAHGGRADAAARGRPAAARRAPRRAGRLEPNRVESRPFLAELLEALGLTADRRFELGAVADGSGRGRPGPRSRRPSATSCATPSSTRAPAGSCGCRRESHGDRIEFAVEDDGPGIPPERARAASSSASTVPRPRAARQGAAASGWRSRGRSSRPTAARSGRTRAPAAAPGWPSSSRDSHRIRVLLGSAFSRGMAS